MARAQASPTDEISRVTLALRGYRVLLDSSLPQRKPGRGRNIEFLSYAYTERGAIMLAAVLLPGHRDEYLHSACFRTAARAFELERRTCEAA
jgi:hypothetical protein